MKLLISLFFLMVIASASALASINLLPPVKPEGLALVGQARLKVLWFDIYDARLSSTSEDYQAGQPLLLSLTYLRDISKKRLLKETEQQLMGKVPVTDLESALSQLNSIWRDVVKNDEIAFLLTPEGSGGFYRNGDYIGSVESKVFNRAFINIWLSEESQFPKLAKALRGEG